MMMFNNNRRSSQTSQAPKGRRSPKQAPGNVSRSSNTARNTGNTSQGQNNRSSRNTNQQRQPGARNTNQANHKMTRRNNSLVNNTAPNISEVIKNIVNANASANASVNTGLNTSTNTRTNPGMNTGMNAGTNTGVNAGFNTGMNTGMNAGMNAGTNKYTNTPTTNYAHQGQYPSKSTSTGGNRTVNKASLFDNPVFRNISPTKMNYLKDMVADMENKPQELKPQVLMTYVIRMRQEGISFTSEELGAVTTALRPTMSEAENRQFDNMVNLMRNMQR